MDSVRELILKINSLIVNPLIILLFAVAIVVFIWGVIQLISSGSGGLIGEDRNKGMAAQREAGKRHVLWGLIGLFIMVGVFGILSILLNTFGVKIPSFGTP